MYIPLDLLDIVTNFQALSLDDSPIGLMNISPLELKKTKELKGKKTLEQKLRVKIRVGNKHIYYK